MSQLERFLENISKSFPYHSDRRQLIIPDWLNVSRQPGRRLGSVWMARRPCITPYGASQDLLLLLVAGFRQARGSGLNLLTVKGVATSLVCVL